MSILTVKNISHSFGGRTIFEDVSFRLLKGEHVGLIGANGEGKSTFMKIITNKLMPDEGNIEWANRVRVAYMDQHSELIEGQSFWVFIWNRKRIKWHLYADVWSRRKTNG